MTDTSDLISAEADELRAAGFDLQRHDHGEFIRAAKCYLDAAVMIERFGPLPINFVHAGWPWGRDQWQPERASSQKCILRAAAFMHMEHERLEARYQKDLQGA